MLDISHGETTPHDVRWTLIIGDLVHNLRSALDHLVCQLALLNSQPLKCCKKTFFPIYINDVLFAERTEKLRLLLHGDAFALIKELQPYKTAERFGHSPTNATLWTISEMDIIDKHRMIIVAVKHYRAMSVSVSLENGPTIEVPVSKEWQPLKDGARIASVDLSAVAYSGEHTARVHTQLEQAICINGTGLSIDGEPVLTVLPLCIKHVSDIVDGFEKQRFSP